MPDDDTTEEMVEEEIVSQHTEPEVVDAYVPPPPMEETEPTIVPKGFDSMSLFGILLGAAQSEDEQTNAATQLRKAIELLLRHAVLSDEESLSVASVYETWVAGSAYVAGWIVRYEGVLYRVLQTHVSEESDTPDAAAALYQAVNGS